MYCNDRVKGGGGVFVYVKIGIVVKRLKLLRDYKILVFIVFDVEIGENNLIVFGLYRFFFRLF